MTRHHIDPLTPASKSQLVLAGIASLITGITFLVFAALLLRLLWASGRLGEPMAVVLISVMVIISIGFLDVAFAVLRHQTNRRTTLLSGFTLYAIGGFLFVIPVLLLGLGLLQKSEWDGWSALRLLSVSGIGVLAIRLARIRSRARATPPALDQA